MASGKAGIHVVQLKPIVVPDLLKEGYKFIKWDDDSTIGTPVTLKVDQYGFFLSWKDQHHETEFLEISSIRDARTGREAKLPRDPKVRDSVTIGPDSVPLEEKTLTVVYGSDLVNVSFINFCCNSRDIAQLWATHTLKMAYNLLAANASSYTLLLKSHTRLTLMADAKGKIPVKHIFKMFVQHKDDKKRVDKALEAVSLPSGKNDKVSSSKLTIDTFFNFRKHLAPRPEVEAIFNQLIGVGGDHSSHASSSSMSSLSTIMSSMSSSSGMTSDSTTITSNTLSSLSSGFPVSSTSSSSSITSGNSHHHHHKEHKDHHHQSVSAVVSSIGTSILSKAAASVSRATGSSSHHSSHQQKVMTVDQLVDFLNKEQRDPRRNEILYPYADRSKGREIIRQFEPSPENRSRDLLSFDGFLRYLMSDECSIVDFEKVDLHQDMDQPLNHYFINSSHNTYLSGHQLTGKASVELYRQALLAGCRCVELDCWNGKTPAGDEEPIITHGYTVVTDIPLKEVLEAISDTAFKTSEYPVILSFENHCSTRQQAKIASHCRKILGERLVTEPLASYPLKPGVPLPSPNALKGKFIIKNKKKDHARRHRQKLQQQGQTAAEAGDQGALMATTGSPISSGEKLLMSQTSSTQLTPQPSLELTVDGPGGDDSTTATANGSATTKLSSMTTPERRSLLITTMREEKQQQQLSDELPSSLEREEDNSHSSEEGATPSVQDKQPPTTLVSNVTSCTVTIPTTTTTSTPTRMPPHAATSTSCDMEDVLESPESSGDEEDLLPPLPESGASPSEATQGGAGSPPSLSGQLSDEGGRSVLGELEMGVDAQIPVATAHIKEAQAGAEMSALVVYIQPVRFHSFEYSERKNRSYEISSFVETEGSRLLKERPVDFVNFNKRQLTRIYPKGTRVDSSNYLPQTFWNAGCQMVALNFQTLDLGMQLNLGIFEYNGRSGYLLKPDFMRRPDRINFDPSTESTVDGIIAGTVAVKIISGQFLSDKRNGTYVEVDMFGLPADMSRKKRTRTVPNNGLNPVYGEEPFVFRKVILPELACLRFAAYEESGKFIGHRIVPITGLRPGYRHIPLRNESGQPLLLPSLFVHITVKDYVPEEFSDMVDALSNPIAYQSMADKARQDSTVVVKRFDTLKEE